MILRTYKLSLLASTLIISGCLESQPAPDLTEYPMADFTIETVITGLDTPWSITPLPSGGYLVTEKMGALKRIHPDGSVQDITGLPDDIYNKQQAGLFDIVAAPDFYTTGLIYLSYAYGTDDSNGTALISANVSGGTLENIKVLFKASPDKDTSAHFGGRIVLMPDASIILTLGDGFVYREAAQDKNSHLGKIVRLNLDGTSYDANPFFGKSDVKTEIYSYGHRNVQGAAFDPLTGDLWAHEHGPRGGDELNLITSGANYGWPLATTGTDYNGAKITPFKTKAGTKAFVKDWVPSIAPSGMAFVTTNTYGNKWKGSLLVGSLAFQYLERLEMSGTQVIKREKLMEGLGRVRDVAEGPDGIIYVAIEDKSFVIYGDEGINKVVPNNFWDGTKDIMLSHFKSGDFKQGLVEGIQKSGEQLKAYFPYLDSDTNEISNTISKG